MLQSSVRQHSTPPGPGLATLPIRCAWCLREENKPLLSTESHGICGEHKALILAAWRARKQVRQQ